MLLSERQLLSGDFFRQLFDSDLGLFNRIVIDRRRCCFSDDIAQIKIDRRRRWSRSLVLVRTEKNLIFSQWFLELKTSSEESELLSLLTPLTSRFCSFAAVECNCCSRSNVERSTSCCCFNSPWERMWRCNSASVCWAKSRSDNDWFRSTRCFLSISMQTIGRDGMKENFDLRDTFLFDDLGQFNHFRLFFGELFLLSCQVILIGFIARC